MADATRYSVLPPCHDSTLKVPPGGFVMSCGCEIEVVKTNAFGVKCYLVAPGPHLRPVVSVCSGKSARELPCPKCGSLDSWMRYQLDEHSRWSKSFEGVWCGKGEHFDRGCRRCSYEWATQDVVKSAAPSG